MFAFLNPPRSTYPSNPRSRQTIDLASVRDTLFYIESDLDQRPELARLAECIHDALAEIDRMELTGGAFEPPQFADAQFVPLSP